MGGNANLIYSLFWTKISQSHIYMVAVTKIAYMRKQTPEKISLDKKSIPSLLEGREVHVGVPLMCEGISGRKQATLFRSLNY